MHVSDFLKTCVILTLNILRNFQCENDNLLHEKTGLDKRSICI